jgi:hypothetical protein
MTPEQQEIERLKAQIERLQAGKQRPSEYSVREDTYKGHPILVFEGPSLRKPFTVGLGKLRAIKACWHRVQEFLDKNKSSSGSQVEDSI